MVTIQLMVTKRNGNVVDFNSDKIKNAVMKAIKATKNKVNEETVNNIVSEVCLEVENRFVEFYPNVENIQDIVEKNLVKGGLYEIAKAYILYRNERKKEREKEREEVIEKIHLGKLRVSKKGGEVVLFDPKKIKESIYLSSEGFENEISVDLIMKELVRNIYDGITTQEIEKAMVLASISFIERDPGYSFVSGRLFLQGLFNEVTGRSIHSPDKAELYKQAFFQGIKKGVEGKIFDERLLGFDLERLSEALKLERDNLLQYMGLQTLYERYFTKLKNKKIELPQNFWMRVAMGLAINEENKNEKAIEFYELLSSLKFLSSTPTLLHSGTTHPQLSSCYLTTIMDDLDHIFKSYGDHAQLSKWSGGLGNDWSSIRAVGSLIKKVNIESQGVIPFLKISNDVTGAINRSGKRRGAACAYLETWHLEIEDFLDLRKNTGDERRRTHDMNTSNWIPDLFMKRVIANGNWTLFSPHEVPELHDLYGREFDKKYEEYEKLAEEGKMEQFKIVSAMKLWRKMLSMLFETGHPWITFKDPCNIRSPQDHVGIIHSSNLCTEITLNTSKEETAVCNLGSINLGRHIKEGEIDVEALQRTIRTAIRMLDNVVDINFYPTIEAKNSNLRHRPIGFGLMGFQDALYKLGINFETQKAVDFSDKSMELISYFSIMASSELAKERGRYSSYSGSKWDRGIFPLDTMALLEQERGMKIPVSREERLNWSELRDRVRENGMRNSNVMAIAPTATISTIAGCYPCIEPIYKNIYVKSNMTGEFTVINPYLVKDLKKIGLWNQEMLDQLKYYDGNVGMIVGIPEELKEKYKSVFDIDTISMINVAAARGKWIDQSQSFNIFIKGVSGRKLHETYIYAWEMGLKTTYYLRGLAASQIEKATLDTKYGFTQKREYQIISPQGKPVNGIQVIDTPLKKSQPILDNVQPLLGHVQHEHSDTEIIKSNDFLSGKNACLIDDPDCEACQ